MKKVKYPECEKLAKVSETSNTIGEFLEWLMNKRDITICQFYPDDRSNSGQGSYNPIHLNIEALLAEFFEIDLNKVEKERRQILKDLRKFEEKE